MNQMRSCFNGIARGLSSFQENSLYIQKIRTFLDYETSVNSPEHPEEIPSRAALTVEDLNFAYGDRAVLKDMNLSVKHGEKIALVGYNGAGKTTLVKLIMRLYDPDSGSIRYGGTDIRKYDLDEYHNQFETVFQDYQLFAASVSQNITMSSGTIDPSRSRLAMIESGFLGVFDSLPNGYDTQVTREFDDAGTLLSGGQAQSLAITRALYKDSPILILDEPSSALDPLAEYNLNKTMLGIRDKTVIIISHRLSTTKMVDKIYMLEDGQIIESGSHDELMRLNGKYADMYNMQANKYV